jgi:cyclopropane fatty-acyl-phospholipid synthase-like methyltransferase
MGALRDFASRHSVTLRLLDPRTWAARLRGARRGDPTPDYWDDVYERNPDPFGYLEKPSETEKFERTLQLAGDRRFPRGLEIGASIGVLSARLAERCDELVITDISAEAVRLARERLASLPNVHVEQMTFPDQVPDGPFDLVVCSEMLFYLTPEQLEEGVRKVESILAPGGTFLAVHWRPPHETQRMTGDQVHRVLHRVTTLTHVEGFAEPKHRFDRWDKPLEG